jgi:hypothetical protein
MVSLSGCADLTSIYRSSDLSGVDGRIYMIDAKQRVVTVKRSDIGDITCSEPSPDALTVFASSFSGSFTAPNQASAQLAANLNETGANIGLRTPSIQLLRDVMYRICEGYAARAIDGPTFATLHRRYQNVMIGLLAIDQLTGATRPATTAPVGGPSGAGNGVTPVQAVAPAQQNASDKAGATTPTKPAPDGEPVASPKTTLQTDNGPDPQVSVALGPAATSVSATSTAVSAKIAEAVQGIVTTVINADYSQDTCEALLLSPRYQGSELSAKYNDALSACLTLVTQRAVRNVNASSADAQEMVARAPQTSAAARSSQRSAPKSRQKTGALDEPSATPAAMEKTEGTKDGG